MSERRTYSLRSRLNQLTQQFKHTVERTTAIPSDRDASVVVAEERMRDAVATIARSRVNQALKQLRETHQLSYSDVQSRTGLSQQFLWDVEYDKRRLTLDELHLLVNLYGLTIADILGVDIEYQPQQSSNLTQNSTRKKRNVFEG